MRLFVFTLVFSVLAGGQGVSPRAAQSAFDQHQFQKSLNLWSDLYKKHPDNFSYGLKTAELTFLLEGRGPALALLEQMAKNQSRFSVTEKELLKKKKKEFLEAFQSEEAQTLMLQASSKTRLKEWQMAWDLVRQANAVESSNLQVLSLKKTIEKHLGKVSEACTTLKSLESLAFASENIQLDRVECDIAQGNYESVKEAVEKIKNPSFREKLALLEAYIQTKALDKASIILESIKTENEKSLSKSIEFHWLAFQFYSQKKDFKKLAAKSKKRVLDLASVPDKTNTSLWDPFQIKTQLASLAK